MPFFLKFPNAVVLKAVGCRKSQKKVNASMQKSINECKERLSTKVAHNQVKKWFGNFHSCGPKIVAETALQTGRPELPATSPTSFCGLGRGHCQALDI